MSETETVGWPPEWWKDFFVAEHVRFQVDLSEQRHDSDAEAGLLIRLAKIGHGTRVLDIPCGHGRHAVRLAQAGAVVTGLDASRAMIRDAERNAAERGVTVNWIQRDMRQTSWESEFDCVICLGGSFGYLGPVDDLAFLTAVQRSLEPGGTLLLDVPSFEYISANHRPLDQSVVGGREVVQHRHLDPVRRTARIRVTIATANGPTSRIYHQQLYAAPRLTTMLTAAGFETAELLNAAELPEYESNTGHVLVIAHKPAR